MPLDLKNLAYLRAIRLPDAPDFGMKLFELITSMATGVNNIEQQTNSNATGQPQPPPAVSALHVTAENGHFQIAINHEGAEFFRSPKYFVEHSETPDFKNPHIMDLGATRNITKFFGNTTLYFRAYAAYSASHPGPTVYHGDAGQPRPVTGGGIIPGPQFSQSQGSGTGTPGQGMTGPGMTPYRTKTGAPPTR